MWRCDCSSLEYETKFLHGYPRPTKIYSDVHNMGKIFFLHFSGKGRQLLHILHYENC